ncbi:uncharacterized protein C2845_PM05G00480 [Panicum miliaceum]|uniref:DUF4378 domain-containing protein n=1 Tax=Panicum miliaceum TaxID=4540 RepID=A0A3L6T3B5_PANMI|nr:uncharacterized protein C2845_PM05G00480 [Panicum miliaceum]
MAATACYGARRLSDLLREQQEPFLEAPQRRSPVDACGRRLRELCALTKRRKVSVSVTDGAGGVTALGRSLLCGGNKTATNALLWGDLAGCFACGARQRFRRLPRAGDFDGRCDVASELDGGGDALDGGRQLSPVSVLELQSDEESPVLSHWDEDDDDKPSTSASSPPSDHDQLPGAATPCPTFFASNGKIRAMEAELEGNSKRLQRKSDYSALEEMERATVSGWERIAADISRIPSLVALDLSGSAREWSRVAGDEEARRVGQSIEAMIFEEVRWEAVRDMICLREF